MMPRHITKCHLWMTPYIAIMVYWLFLRDVKVNELEFTYKIPKLLENSCQKRRHKLDRSNDREIEEKKDFFHRKRKQILKIVSIYKRRAGNSILCSFAGSIV